MNKKKRINEYSYLSKNGRSRIPVIIGSPFVIFLPGVRGDEFNVNDDVIDGSSSNEKHEYRF